MSKPRIIMHTTLDLTPPKAAESREAVLQRCIATVDCIRTCLPVVFEDTGFRADIGSFLDDMKLYFEPDLPPELVRFLREWNALSRGPAA